MKHDELEAQADALLREAGYLYDRSDNPAGEIYTEQQIRNTHGREIPATHWMDVYADEDDSIIPQSLVSYDTNTYDTSGTALIDLFAYAGLTPLQEEISYCLAEGMTLADIARKLGCSRQHIHQTKRLIAAKLTDG